MGHLNRRGWARPFEGASNTHHPELLQFLVAFDEERTLPVSRPVAVAFTSPTCGEDKNKRTLGTRGGLTDRAQFATGVARLRSKRLLVDGFAVDPRGGCRCRLEKEWDEVINGHGK